MLYLRNISILLGLSLVALTSSAATQNPMEAIVSVKVISDNTMPPICPGAYYADGIMVTFRYDIDERTLEGGDFLVLSERNEKIRPMCALTSTANRGSSKSIILVGEFGSMMEETPKQISIVGELLTKGGEVINLNGATFSNVLALKSNLSLSRQQQSSINPNRLTRDASTATEAAASLPSEAELKKQEATRPVAMSARGQVMIGADGNLSINQAISAYTPGSSKINTVKITSLTAAGNARNRQLHISFELPKGEMARLELLDKNNVIQRVIDEERYYASGVHGITVFQANLPAGEYKVRLLAESGQIAHEVTFK